jgi:hypothetical protein
MSDEVGRQALDLAARVSRGLPWPDAPDGKKECRRDLLKEFGLSLPERTPVVGISSYLTRHKGFDLIRAAAASLRELDFGLVVHPPAREEGGERKFGKNDELRAHAVRFLQQILQSGNGGGSGVGFVVRPELGGGDPEVSGHGVIR